MFKRKNLVRVLIFLFLLNRRPGNTVKIPLSTSGDSPSTVLLVMLNNTDLLEGLEDLAVDGAGGVDVVGRCGTAVLGCAVDFAEAADTDGFAEVDVAGYRGGADVEPGGILLDC